MGRGRWWALRLPVARYNVPMRVISLQSGSSGNSIYVEAGDVRLLFDAGISGAQAQRRLEYHRRDIREIDALLISHDHVDHSRNMGVYHRKFGLPVYATERTHRASLRHGIGEFECARHFVAGESLRLGNVTVETIPTPHDAADGAVFVVDDGKRRLGVLTDLGHVFEELAAVIETLDAVILESNYDPRMLRVGSYPEQTKQRIAGPAGHLSNSEAARLLCDAAPKKMQWACLAHLSNDNNTVAIALATHRKLLKQRMPLVVATRDAATEVLKVS